MLKQSKTMIRSDNFQRCDRPAELMDLVSFSCRFEMPPAVYAGPAVTLTLTWPPTFIMLHFATHAHDVPAFSSPAFSTAGNLVACFPVLRFPPLRFSPVFSTPAIWSHVFQSWLFQSHVFSPNVKSPVERYGLYTTGSEAKAPPIELRWNGTQPV